MSKIKVDKDWLDLKEKQAEKYIQVFNLLFENFHDLKVNPNQYLNKIIGIVKI